MTTATFAGRDINGIAVIAEEPIESGISRPDRLVYFTRMRRLLLADDSTLIACTECHFTDPKVGTVRIHLRDHGKAAAATGLPPELLAMTLGELLEPGRRVEQLLNALERLANERDEWKARCRKAERNLSTVRKALVPATR